MVEFFTSSIPKGVDMGRITTPAVVENRGDGWLAEAGSIPFEAIRRIEVPEALVDTGTSSLCMPTSLIHALGLKPMYELNSRTAGGMRKLTVYSEVILRIQDRFAHVLVTEIPEGSPVLIGQIPLEEMDLVPLPKEQKLIANPAHGGEWIMEIY